MKKNVMSNIWLKRSASIIGFIYAIYVCVLAFRSVFYEVVITKPIMFCIYISTISIVAMILMIYSRKQVATRLAAFIMPIALLPIVIMCLGAWEFIIPIAICAVVIFFACGSNEGTKTLLGTIYLLVYILTALAYFIFTSYLASPAITKTIEEGLSPSGKYRYEVINTTDSSNGSTTVTLEPNDMDIIRKTVIYESKGYEHKICVKRPITEVKIEWKDDDMYINGERWFTPAQAEKGKWFEKESYSFNFM